MHKWVNNWRNLRHIVITFTPSWKIVKSYVKNNFQIWTLLLLNATNERYIKYEHYYYWTLLLNATSNMKTTTTERLSARKFENLQLIKKLNISRVTLKNVSYFSYLAFSNWLKYGHKSVTLCLPLITFGIDMKLHYDEFWIRQ